MSISVRAAALAAVLVVALPTAASASSVLLTFDDITVGDLPQNASNTYLGTYFTTGAVIADPEKGNSGREHNTVMQFFGTVTIHTAFSFRGIRLNYYDGLGSINFGDVNCDTCFPNHYSTGSPSGWKDPTNPQPVDDFNAHIINPNLPSVNQVTITGALGIIDNLEFYDVEQQQQVPEPMSLALVTLALGCAGYTSRKR